ncbi:MAG: DUF3857 domain-containing protein [Mucilaginibacter sp.]
MKKTFTLLALCAFTHIVQAQDAAPVYEAYGKIPMEELQMTSCPFDKTATAEVLDAKGDVYFDDRLNTIEECHKRIKIFKDDAKDQATCRIEFYSNDNLQYVSGIQAETINLVDGKEQITKLDKKQIFRQAVDRDLSAITFSMPDVKAGSIIEYKYTLTTTSPIYIPSWDFQEDIPVRYSEYITAIPEYFSFTGQTHMRSPFTKFTRSTGNGSIGSLMFNTNIEDRLMTNVPSLPDEPYMSSKEDNTIDIAFQLASFHPPVGFVENFSNSWQKIGERLVDDEDFGRQFRRSLSGEDVIIAKAKALKTDDAKIAYLFNEVKNDMKWNNEYHIYTDNGTSKAWDTKTGSSTEINLILYHLLRKSGVNAAIPMLVSTRSHGKVNPVYTNLLQFNSTVVYIPVDSTKNYILDASDKYNMYSETPYNLLNSFGLYINADAKDYNTIFISHQAPVRRSVFINAEIKPGGKIDGTAVINNLSYSRIQNISRYKSDGETKFKDYLTDKDNNLKISSLKIDNMDVDTLPLVQNINFNLDLSSDDTYLYLNPNLFTEMHKNPFTNDVRKTDIDFGYQDNLSYNGIYKVPTGYTIEGLPKSISMTTPDNSIIFRRMFGQQDGSIVVRYTVQFKKSIFFKEDYADYHEFFKKMYEMMNENIVLKKS